MRHFLVITISRKVFNTFRGASARVYTVEKASSNTIGLEMLGQSDTTLF
jgi:hypothetical protein